MGLFIKKIIDHLDESAAAQVSVRKPRKKKEKPAHMLVAKMKYKVEDKDLNITSVQPKDIIHASQLWVYNCKYRNLSVYTALGPSGLSVRGTTIIGYDQDVSVTKKLRKPEQVLPIVLNEGKVGLRKVMSTIKTAEQKANGRINEESILLRIIK